MLLIAIELILFAFITLADFITPDRDISAATLR